MIRLKSIDEWFRQSDYDLETANSMFKAGRYIYTVFMCHLSIEKALKGLYTKKYQKNPPKIHNLDYLCEEIGLDFPQSFKNFIDNLNNLSVPTRYPDELRRLLQEYKRDLTEKVYNQTKELLLWLKQKRG